MIIYRQKGFTDSNIPKNRKMLTNIINKLDSLGIDSFDVSDRVSKDDISIIVSPDPVIYIPIDLEYSQYDIEDYIRTLSSSLRAKTSLDRNIYKMTLTNSVTESQLLKIIKYIISKEEYCNLI